MTWDEFTAELLPQPHSISVEAYEGSGAHGDILAAPVEVTPCFVDQARKLVRVQTTDAAGHEQVSTTTVYAPPATVAAPGSRVTYNGRTSRVLAAAVRAAAGMDLPEHVELSLE